MTTIVLDNIERKVYTDSRASVTHKKETRIHSDTFVKVFYSSRCKTILGSGSVKQIKKYIEALLSGKNLPKLKNTVVMECIKYPIYKVIMHTTTGVTSIDINERFLAFGSGADIAMGNLFSTNDPVKAIQAASSFDYCTGGGIVEYDLSGRFYNDDIH